MILKDLLSPLCSLFPVPALPSGLRASPSHLVSWGVRVVEPALSTPGRADR